MSNKNKNLPAPSVPASAAADRIERFQSLSAGQYWCARVAIPEQGIEAGELLLIQSIRWVDDKPHTIILRPHPKNIGQSFTVKERDADGHMRTRFYPYDEHRFLLDDFIARFEYEPEAAQVRADELKQVQSRVTELQRELLEGQHNPERLAQIVDEGLREAAENTKDGDPEAGASTLSVAADPEKVSLATGSVKDAIAAGMSDADVEHIKAVAACEHQIATIKAKWIEAKTTEIAETIQAMTPFYEEQAAAALAQTEDVRTYVTQLTKGIESLDLYVGKNVHVETICEGEPAPADEPLTFVQRKLLMDEEFAVWADVGENFDFSHQGRFFKALAENKSLVEQIFPAPRCVLVMAVTRREVEYREPMESLLKNLENKKVFMLVRNGENIHRVVSPVESHLGAARLFPTKDDQDRFFRGFDGTEIKFEDVAFTDHLELHEAHALHYKRFLLLVCGLDHRLKLFGDFYEGPPSMNFLSLEFQERYCRFLHDDEKGQLLGENRPAVSEWIKQKNAYLRSGSRVLCNWRELMNPTTAPAACQEQRASRYSDHNSYIWRYKPANAFDVVVARREGESLVVDIEVSGERARDFRERTFRCKVNLSLLENGYWSYTDLPFLCLDAVEPEDLRWYIHNREARVDHLKYIRFFKRALAHVETERKTERRARERLTQSLVEGGLATPELAPALVSRTVVAWRAENRGRELPSPLEGESTAPWRSLLKQLYGLARTGEDEIAEVDAYIWKQGYEPLRLVLDGSARLKVYTAPTACERDDRVMPHAWTHCFILDRTGGKLKRKSRRWALLPQAAAMETVLHEWPGAEKWAVDLARFLREAPFRTFEEKQKVFEQTRHFRKTLERWMRPMTARAEAELLEEWMAARSAYLRGSRIVRDPHLAVPVGVVRTRYGRVHLLCVGTSHAEVLLFQRAATEELRTKLRKEYIGAFANAKAAAERFDEAVADEHRWWLYEVPLDVELLAGSYLPPDAGYELLSGRDQFDPRLSTWLKRFPEREGVDAEAWLPPEAFDGEQLVLDELLDIKLPADYAPVTLYEIELELEDLTLPTYSRWFDVFPGVDDDYRAGIRKSERCQVPEGYGHMIRLYEHASPAAARAAMDEMVEGEAVRIVAATELPNAPPAPEGAERWYVLDDE